MAAGSPAPLVHLDRLTKRFPRVVAVDDVSLDLMPGQIHALVGENGAGKTTLMNLLYGVHQPDDGVISIAGHPVSIRRPADAIHAGFALVHQHFKLVPSFTVAENLMLVRRHQLGSVPDRHAFAEDVRQLGERYGLQVDPDAKIRALPLGLRQRVEVLGGLVRDARILILDEPTTVLPPPQIEELFHTMRQIASEGRAVVLITHRLAEVFEVGDWFSVMRAGRLVASAPTSTSTPAEVASLMVGREVAEFMLHGGGSPDPGLPVSSPVLRIRGVSVAPEEASPGLHAITFDLRAGEIVGIAGVEGNGQHELVEVLGGLQQPTSGDVVLAGEEITTEDPRHIAELGLGIIPEDRHGEGLILEMSLTDNLTLDRIRSSDFSRGGVWLHVRRMRRFARRLIDRFTIRTASEQTPAKMLSGGNQQKVVLARVMASNPRVLVAAQPTRGLDIAATHYVMDQLNEAKAMGAGVILISSDLDQILALADRVLVLYKGRIVAELAAADATRELLGLYMAGLAGASHEKSSDALHRSEES